MTTVYTTSNRLAVMTPGDPAVKNSWGTIQDATVNMTDQALDGISIVDLTGLTTYSLTVANNASDQARPRTLQFIGIPAANCTVTLPNVPKVGWVQNLTTGGFSVILTAGAGTTATIPPGALTFLYLADGATNVTLPQIVPAISGAVFQTLSVSGASSLATVTATDVAAVTLETLGAATFGGTASVQGLFSPFGGIAGNPTGASPSAGSVGEYLRGIGAGIALVTGSQVQAAQVPLSAGDWDVWGRVNFQPPSGGAYQGIFGWINTNQGTFNASTNEASMTISASFTAGGAQIMPVGITRLSSATSFTAFLLATGNFTGSGATVSGLIQARRRD